MAPHTSSTSSPSPPVAFLGRGAPPAVVQPNTEYRCKFCGEEFDNRYVFSAHYYVHKGLPDQTWIELGPKNSKVRRRIIARLEGRESQPKRKKAGRPPKAETAKARDRARTLSPEPIRAIFPPGSSRQLPFPVMGVRPTGQARARSPEPIRATPIRAFCPPGASPQLQAGSSRVVPAAAPGSQARDAGPGVRLQGRGWLPVLRDYASWMTHFRQPGPVGRAQEPGGLRVHKDNGAGPSSNAGSGVADKLAPAEFGPPPGFGHVLPDLNFPISINIKPVKKEIIIID